MGYVRCWTCVGNGILTYPNEPTRRCPDCRGTGADIEKTKQIGGTIPSPLPLMSYEKSKQDEK